MARRKSRSKLYSLWASMLRRCDNPKQETYRFYGGRGVKVGEEWRTSFVSFAAYIDAHMGPCPPGMSLDRIDSDGDYRPGNVRWATAKQQRANQRPRNALIKKVLS